MYRVHRERLKSYILTFLIITSFVQVGVLWGYQNHGLPLNLFGLFNKRYESTSLSQAEKTARDSFFIPYRAIISDGNMSHWLIGQNNEFHTAIWDSAKSCLGEILSSKQSSMLPDSEWGGIVQKKGFVFEFKSGMSSNLLKWFLDISSISSDTPNEIHKFMIQTEYRGEASLYILSDNVVYKYPLGTRTRIEQAGLHAKVLDKLKADEGWDTKAYSMFGEMFQHQSVHTFISPDILGIPSSSRYRDYKSISYYIPGSIGDKEAIADIIFPGNEKDSYDRYIDNNDTVIFRNLDSFYRIYGNGFLEYKYLPGYDIQDKGTMGSAFVNAAKFVNTVNKNMNNTTAGLYLSRAREKDGAYEFAFDYIIGDIPVFIEAESKPGSGEIIRNAAVIETNGKRNLGCYMALRIFDQIPPLHTYKVDTVSILDSSGLNIRDYTITDMGISYHVDLTGKRREPPVWYIETAEGGNYFVGLPGQGD